MLIDSVHVSQILMTRRKTKLYLGDIQSAQNISFIVQNNIYTIITAASGFQYLKYNIPGIRHYRYGFHDVKNQNMMEFFNQICQKIYQGLKFGSVLVHCGAGISRSATLVIAYLIKYKKMSFQNSLNYVRSRRQKICPNLGFELQLKRYASQNTIKSSSLLARLRQSCYTPKQLYRKGIQWNSNGGDSLDGYGSHRTHSINANMLKYQMTQPKGWRITYSLKPQFLYSNFQGNMGGLSPNMGTYMGRNYYNAKMKGKSGN